MQLEKKTSIYILLGLIYITVVIGAQGGWSIGPKINYMLLGEYNTERNPDLIVDNKSEGAISRNDYTITYNGYYIRETYDIGDEVKLNEGILILLERNYNYIEKMYSEVPPGSKIIISAYNDISSSELNKGNYCESVKMTVNQDGRELKTFNVENKEEMKEYKLEPLESKSQSKFTLEINSNHECNNITQSLGVDKFYLDKNYEPN